ncbi:hypothetical protein F3Y22_tig00110963pilonHSYRG00042 [Hibiscus syriacus]|uniref:Uncharacterized protein n=1 Tax=Hibiscus syriacus TaxID=106335 RepID=A0A6A2ZAQ0_HIBSY|nr:hypothetical protein F3Y22_tig00110963pilonHSYRG00042 [Hibiscus syriacus]
MDQLCDLYENDSIFDKFECCLSGDGLRVATGSYSNLFRVFGCAPGSTETTTLEASKNPMRRQVQTPSRPSRSLSSLTRVVRRGAETPGVDANGNSFDFTTKLLHLAWHPTENSIACAAANSLYIATTIRSTSYSIGSRNGCHRSMKKQPIFGKLAAGIEWAVWEPPKRVESKWVRLENCRHVLLRVVEWIRIRIEIRKWKIATKRLKGDTTVYREGKRWWGYKLLA